MTRKRPVGGVNLKHDQTNLNYYLAGRTVTLPARQHNLTHINQLGAEDAGSEGRAERHDARRLGEDGVQGLGQVVLHEVPLEDVLAGEGLGTHGAGVRAVVGLRGEMALQVGAVTEGLVTAAAPQAEPHRLAILEEKRPLVAAAPFTCWPSTYCLPWLMCGVQRLAVLILLVVTILRG